MLIIPRIVFKCYMKDINGYNDNWWYQWQHWCNTAKYSNTFGKANKQFCLGLHCNHDNSYLFVDGKEVYKFKADDKNVNFPTQFCLGSISNKFDAADSRQLSLKGNVYDFSVDYDTINKSDIINIHKF